jgi:hypothetical protein
LDRNKNPTENSRILDLSIYSKFNVEVVLEKAMRKSKKGSDTQNESGKARNKTKEVVDIVVKITRQNKRKEDLTYLFAKDDPIALILIENKIKFSDKASEQLLSQYQTSLGHLPTIMDSKDWEKWKDKICTILIAPESDDFGSQFNDFTLNERGNKRALYFAWVKDRNEEVMYKPVGYIDQILNDLLNAASDGTISPINNYVEQTLYALLNFIYNDFSSDADDQQQGGRNTWVYYDSLEDLWDSGNSDVDREIFEKIIAVNTEELQRKHKQGDYTKTHMLRFGRKGKKKFSITARGKSAVFFVTSSFFTSEMSRQMVDWGFKLRSNTKNEFLIDMRSVEEIMSAIAYLDENLPES